MGRWNKFIRLLIITSIFILGILLLIGFMISRKLPLSPLPEGSQSKIEIIYQTPTQTP